MIQLTQISTGLIHHSPTTFLFNNPIWSFGTSHRQQLPVHRFKEILSKTRMKKTMTLNILLAALIKVGFKFKKGGEINDKIQDFLFSHTTTSGLVTPKKIFNLLKTPQRHQSPILPSKRYNLLMLLSSRLTVDLPNSRSC